MNGKKVLVTGSDTGIGRGVAMEFASEGAEVALHYPHQEGGARTAVEEIRSSGGKAEAFQADFNDLEQVKSLCGQALEFLGGLDVLVNNAGVTTNIPFEEIKPEQYDTLYNINIRAGFFMTQNCLPALIGNKPSAIINLASVHAFFGCIEHSIYAGTKGAIVAYTRELGIELAPKGVRVNAIAPGWIVVDNHHKVMGDDLNLDEAAYGIPIGFVGEPVDVARLAIFLASEEARYIVGQCIILDGGQMSLMANTGDFHERLPWTFGQGYVPGI